MNQDKDKGRQTVNLPGFTPGPWVGCIRFTPIGLGFDFNLAWLTAERGSPRDLEARANARLIAAAPDLYEALQVCANKFWEYVIIHEAKLPGGDPGEAASIAQKVARNREMAELCEAALAKANGKQP